MVKKKANPPEETFGESIDKFATAATQFAITQATHNERLNGIDSQMRNLQGEVHQLREFRQQQDDYMNKRIDTVHADFSHRMNEMEAKLDTQTVTLTTHIDDALKGVGQRLQTVETWRYLVQGGAVVIGFLFSEFMVKLLFGEGTTFDILKKIL